MLDVFFILGTSTYRFAWRFFADILCGSGTDPLPFWPSCLHCTADLQWVPPRPLEELTLIFKFEKVCSAGCQHPGFRIVCRHP